MISIHVRLYFVSGFIRTACKLFWVGRSAGRPAGRPGGGSPTAKPVKGGVWGAKPPQPKFGGSGGQRPPAKTEKFSKNFEKVYRRYLCYKSFNRVQNINDHIQNDLKTIKNDQKTLGKQSENDPGRPIELGQGGGLKQWRRLAVARQSEFYD